MPDPNAKTQGARCRHLRTKAMHVFGSSTPDAYASSRGSGYHCLRTAFVTGPDHAPCCPEDCQASRACFEASE